MNTGSCHCGAVQFEINSAKGVSDTCRCNCSMCAKRGAIMMTLPIENFTLIKGKDVLSLYQFNTKIAEHYFCSTCGIFTHQKLRSDPSKYAINVACIDGVDPYNLDDIRMVDGQNHACDRNND